MSQANLTADAIAAIVALNDKAHRVVFLQRPGDPKHVVHLLKADGSIEAQAVEPAPLAIGLETPEAFIAYASQIKNPENAIILFSEERILLFLDAGERRDRAVCSLTFSPQFEFFKTNACAQWRSQREFVRLLRIDLNGCLLGSNLLELTRQIKWKTRDDGGGAIQHGRESMGRTIEEELYGEGAIPEEVIVKLPVWEEATLAVTVSVAVELNAQDKTFRLTPYPLGLKKALDAAVEELGKNLKLNGLPPSFRGDVND